MDSSTSKLWWRDAVGYQIWPASFMDSNGDGVGDIKGIVAKLDHLARLGVNLLWLSPVYDSPQHDMGYDVRNYEDIWSKYGSLDDMLALIQAAKQRGMRLLMDLVINHTSDEHVWFQESRSSRSNPKSDWYIWRDGWTGPDGKIREPNNWRAAFGGSVWTYEPQRNQYYLHLALPEQPDLNWQNADARQAIYDSAVDFWLRRGIDGFRVDVVNFWWKDTSFPDAKVTIPQDRYQPMEGQHIINGPDVHLWLKELRSRITASYGEDIVLIGELPATPHDEVMKYISSDSKELNMVFDFDTFMAGNDWNSPLHERKNVEMSSFKDAVAKAQNYLDCSGKTWPITFLESHDFPRSVSHFGPGAGHYHQRAAKMLALLSTTLSGTLFLYQGQEIGMTNVPSSWGREQFRDRSVSRYFDEIDHDYPDNEVVKAKALRGALRFGRDNARTPVQWSKSPYGGFSSVEPWIPINDNFAEINVADQTADGDSILSFFKGMIKLRREHLDLLVYGKFTMQSSDSKTLVFAKTSLSTSNEAYVLLNFSGENVKLDPSLCRRVGEGKVLMSNVASEGARMSTFLQPWEGTVLIRP